MLFWGPDFELADVNGAFLEMTGFSREGALGKTWQDLTPEEYHAASRHAVVQIETSGVNEPYEKEYYRADGSRFWGLFAARQISETETVEFVLDVTERKEAEEALRRLNETFEDRVEERTAQVRALGSKLAVAEQEERRRLAHLLHDDLQQRLYGLSMTLRLLVRAPPERDWLAEQAGGILDEATDLTRTLATELSPAVLETDRLADVLRWLAEWKRKRLGLDVEVAGDADVPDPALRTLVYHLVRELLFNVAKHADGHVAVTVEDDGAGFDVAVLDGPGDGFGLASVR